MTGSMPTDSRENPLAEEFVRRFARNHQKLYSYIFSLVLDREGADEVFQETSLILWREFENFRQEADFMPWAAAIAFNQMRKFWRKRKADRHTFSDALLQTLAKDAAPQAEALDERQIALSLCMQKLRDRDREMVRLYYADKTNAQQVADKLEISIHTVYKGLQRIRAALLECIERRLSQQEAAS